jgi:hypothetical protein
VKIIRSILDDEEILEFGSKSGLRYSWFTRAIESKFLSAAEQIIDGSRAADDTSERAKQIVAAIDQAQALR